MQEPSKPQDTPEMVDASKISNMREPSKPQNTPERVDASKISNTREPSKPQDTPEMVDASKISNMREPSKPQDTPEMVDASKIPEQPSMQHAADATDTTPVPGPTRALLVAVLVAAGIIAITWSLSGPSGEQALLDQTLKETRAKLTAASDELKDVREAKASVDGALAETQARLTAEQEKRLVAEKAVAAEQEKRLMAEKAVADVKAVLASIPSDASPNPSSTPTEPTNEPSPK